jgi:5-oxoprolinase (ATP-hydrolysing)
MHVRYQGTDTALVVDFGDDLAAIQRDFEAGYRQRFAFLMPGRALVIEAVSVEAVAAGERHDERRLAAANPCPTRPAPDARVRMHSGAVARRGLFVRESLRAGAHHRRPGRSLPSATPPPWSSPAGRPR